MWALGWLQGLLAVVQSLIPTPCQRAQGFCPAIVPAHPFGPGWLGSPWTLLPARCGLLGRPAGLFTVRAVIRSVNGEAKHMVSNVPDPLSATQALLLDCSGERCAEPQREMQRWPPGLPGLGVSFRVNPVIVQAGRKRGKPALVSARTLQVGVLGTDGCSRRMGAGEGCAGDG